MNILKRFISIGLILALACCGTLDFLRAAVVADDGPFSEWSGWENRAIVNVIEMVGEDRINEPVEINVKLDKAKSDGSDIQIIDSTGQEVPYQLIHIGDDKTFILTFFANVPSLKSQKFYVLYNNPVAKKPNYGQTHSVLDNQLRVWQTNEVFIQWGGKAGYYRQTTEPITVLKFDDIGSGIPSNGIDRLTDDVNAWDPDKSYGYLGSTINGYDPLGFGSSQGLITANGPVFSEIKLGSAWIRSYKGKKNWIMTDGSADSLHMFGRWYDREKHGGSAERLIRDNGLGDAGPWVTYYSSTQANPGYMCFRRSDTGLIFGAVGANTARWSITAKESGGYDRIISLNDSSTRPNAKIYWYSDTSNSYEGIERFSKQMLNPLKVEVIVDTEPPVTNATITPSLPDGLNEWYVTQPQIKLSSSEDGTTYFRLNAEDYRTYESTITIPEGMHDLYYYSIDLAGNEEQEKSLQLKVDYSLPEIKSDLYPVRINNHYYINELITFSYEATDSVSGVGSIDAALDGTSILNGDQVSFSKVGEHSLSIKAIDVAGNVASKTETFTVGYGFKWLPPVKKKDDLEESPYIVRRNSTAPITFGAFDGLGKFVVDESVKVVVSDGANEAVFVYGKRGDSIKINPCNGRYLLNLRTKNYPWLKPGGDYSISVYFGGDSQHTGVLHDKVTLELK